MVDEDLVSFLLQMLVCRHQLLPVYGSFCLHSLHSCSVEVEIRLDRWRKSLHQSLSADHCFCQVWSLSVDLSQDYGYIHVRFHLV